MLLCFMSSSLFFSEVLFLCDFFLFLRFCFQIPLLYILLEFCQCMCMMLMQIVERMSGLPQTLILLLLFLNMLVNFFFEFTCYLIYYFMYPLLVFAIYSVAFLMLYGIALATEGWGVVASLKIYPPFAGAAVSAITLVVSFGFAVSRPCLTLKVCEVIVTDTDF